MNSFQDLFLSLQKFWSEQGCFVSFPYDIEKGAGTFNPMTFFGVLGQKDWNVCFVEPSRRPTDGRYGENPNRLYIHHQFQVIMKPSPRNIQDLYCRSLEAIGLDLKKHDLRFVQDDWESPTLGAAGLGWEVWIDGMEITQFTYFQQMAGLQLDPISVELTYGLERISMFLQDQDNLYDLSYHQEKEGSSPLLYRDLFQRREYECSVYNFEKANLKLHKQWFDGYESEFYAMIEKNLPLVAYDYVLKASHAFNILDARNAISTTERVFYIEKVRNMAKKCASIYQKLHEDHAS